jgi:hypothetical protein
MTGSLADHARLSRGLQSQPGQVDGFDYVAVKAVSKTPLEWQRAYPAHKFTRTVVDGETRYSTRVPKSAPDARPRLVAEVYWIVPEAQS